MPPRRLPLLFLPLAIGCGSAANPVAEGGGSGGTVHDAAAERSPTPDASPSAGPDASPDAALDGGSAAPLDARPDLPPEEAGPSCESGLTASSTLVQPGCNAGLHPGGVLMIPDGSYTLVSIDRDFRCLPELFSPPASGTIRVSGTDIAGVDGAMGPNGVTFSAWKGTIMYFGGSDVQVNLTCGDSDRFGDQIMVDQKRDGFVTFFRPKASALEGWTYRRQ
jgi:hypothetical protein